MCHNRTSSPDARCRANRPSLRQPRHSKTLHILGAIFRPTKWRHDVAEVGNAKQGIKLTQPFY